MINQFVFEVTRPTDKLHKPFNSTWIYGSTAAEAKEILNRTYREKDGFVLTLIFDLNKIAHAKFLNRLSGASLNSAML